MALTDDKSGAKLPKRETGSWVFERETTIDEKDGPRIGADSKEVIESIKRDGYFIWPQKSDKAA